MKLIHRSKLVQNFIRSKIIFVEKKRVKKELEWVRHCICKSMGKNPNHHALFTCMQIENKMAPLIQPSEAGPKYFPMASNPSELSLWEHLWSRKSTSDRYTAQGEVLCIWCKRLTKLHSLVLPWLLRLSLFGSSCYFWWSSSSPLLLILISSNNVLALGVQTSSVNLLRCCSCRWIISTMEAVNWQVWRTCSVVVLPRKRGLWQSVRLDNLHYACSMADCNLVCAMARRVLPPRPTH